MSPRVLVEVSPSLDTQKWSRLHGMGLVPDRVPYGLDRLANDGFTVVVRTPPRARPIEFFGRVGGRLTGGARWPESLLGRPSPSAADVRLCWDERMGIPAVLTQPSARHRRPVVSGAIWITESDVNLSAFARWMIRSALQRVDAVFVLSSGQVSPLREVWDVNTARIHLVPFGIDTDFWKPSSRIGTDLYRPRSSGSSIAALEQPGNLAIASVGNDRHRDHRLLLAAFREVHSRLPKARLELVTRMPFDIPADVGRWQKDLTHVQLRELYSYAQVVAVSTQWNNHASGITAVLEAMAMGKPVVATRTPGLDDYVVNGETGVLVPHDDRDAIADALVELLKDSDRRAELGAEARRRALAHFSTQAQARRLAAVLDMVV